VNDPRHLQLLALILEDCPSHHSTSLWWNVLLPGLTKQIVHLHAQFTQREKDNEKEKESKHPTTTTTTSRSTTSSSTSSSSSLNKNRFSIISRRRNFNWLDRMDIRRYRFQSPVVRVVMDESSRDELFLASMTLLERLIACTRLDLLGTWYCNKGDAVVPKQPYLMEDPGDAADESAHLCIGLLLDIVESLDCFQNLRKALLDLPGWYVPLVSLLSTVGQTIGGMKILRSRLPDSTGGEVRPNVIDTAIVQLYQLSLMDMEDEASYLDKVHEQRLFVMGYWLRLLHQVLIFVQSTTATTTTSTTRNDDSLGTTISFRSLVVDTHDYYTSACTRIMTDAFVDPEIISLIRLQLDELAMDQEEYDDLKYK